MATKIRSLSKIVGQTQTKNILTNLIMNENVPEFMIFTGSSGSGKSTFAEWYAMSVTCTEGHIEPCMRCEACLDNLQGLETSGVSSHIKKINMAKLNKKDDMKDVIRDVFNLQPIPGEKTFYIFEEIQELGENQGILLDEMDRIPKDTHILACTTDPHKIRDTLLSRASFKFTLNKLNHKDCMLLIDKLCIEYNINLDKTDKNFLANSSKHNARIITNTLENVKDLKNIREVIRTLYNIVDVKHYLDFLELSFKDFANFIIGVNILEMQVNIIDFWMGFSDFMRNAIFYHYANEDSIFTKEECERIDKIFKVIKSRKVQKIFKLTKTFCKNSDDVELQLMNIHELIHQDEITKKVVREPEAVKVSAPELKEEYTSETKPKKEVKKLTMDILNDSSKNFKTLVRSPKLQKDEE